MRILITGNMGYIGPELTAALRAKYPDCELVGIDMGFFAHCLTTRGALPETLLDEQWFGDVRELPAARLEGVDAIVHLAAISNDPMGKQFETVTDEINYRSTARLAQFAKQAGVRAFVFASSCSMYGFAADDARNEDSGLNPLTAYARSKVASEGDLKALAGPDFVVTSLRFATACGMSPRLRLDLVLNDFVAGAVASRQISILSDGTPWRPLIAVPDMVRAMDWAVHRPADHGGAFLAVNAGSDVWNYQVKDLARAVAEIVPGVSVSINPDAPPDKRSYRVDFSLFKRLAPDHQPLETLSGAIHKLKAGLEAIDFNDADFRNSTLIRLKVLTHFRESGTLSENLHWRYGKTA